MHLFEKSFRKKYTTKREIKHIHEKTTNMKRFALLITTIFFGATISAQTSQQEYSFLTNEYASIMAKGLVPEMDGHYLEDLLELADKSGKVKLLYKNDQISIEPVATQIHIYDGDRTFYICVPSDKSEKDVYNQYTDDIQAVFKLSDNAQSVFSLIMAQYPIELQRYYDEIKALEKAYAMEAVAAEKGSNVTYNEGDNVAKGATKSSIVVKEYAKPENGETLSVGKLAQSIGGGLKSRKVIYSPELINSTGKSGTIRLNVCVDNNGKLVRSTLQTDRSSSKDADLVATATTLLKQYKFNRSASSRQCGYIVFEFK